MSEENYTQKFMRDPDSTAAAEKKIEAIVLASMITHPCTTSAEQRRRVRVCVYHIKEMLNDMHWTLQRALATAGERLRCDLEGIDWEPAPGDSYVRGGELLAPQHHHPLDLD